MKIVTIVLIIISINICRAQNIYSNNYVCAPLRTDDIDEIIRHLLASTINSKVFYNGSLYWQNCSDCRRLIENLECLELHCGCSDYQKRIVQQVKGSYLSLKKISEIDFALFSGNHYSKTMAVLNICLLMENLKEEVRAAFEDNVPDNKELGIQLKQNMSDSKENICQEIKDQRELVENKIIEVTSKIDSNITATSEQLKKNIDNSKESICQEIKDQRELVENKIIEVTSKIDSTSNDIIDTIKILKGTIDTVNKKLDELLKDRSEIASTSCVVIGLAYYTRGVVGGWISARTNCLSYRLTVTGEILDYHDQVTDSSHRGVRLGGGYLVADKYNISVGLVLFDRNIDPYEKNTLNLAPNVLHHIHISFDYWRSKDISLGIGYSVLTGLGGRVLLGL